MPWLSEPNIIHLQLAVSFIIPFNLLDSARSQSKICTVYLGVSRKAGARASGCLCMGPVATAHRRGRIISVPGASGWRELVLIQGEVSDPLLGVPASPVDNLAL